VGYTVMALLMVEKIQNRGSDQRDTQQEVNKDSNQAVIMIGRIKVEGYKRVSYRLEPSKMG
jgi:hypothetical protein